MQSTIFKAKANPRWRNFEDEKLLDMRIKDVYLPIEKTGLNPFIKKLYQELKAKGVQHFRPHVWFSDEWFTPDGLGGIAIPFFLSHRRLARLQEKFLYEIEGGTPRWFMQLLRHECGHAIDNAYRLRRKRQRQKIFGLSTTPYRDYYVPKPFSRKFVVHLDTFYAQSHPDEDFAETFAVWLNPRSSWRKRYQGWGALKKLQYMDELIKSIGHKKPVIRSQRVEEPQQKITTTLREHYKSKQAYYGLDYPDVYDVQLFKLFTNNPELAQRMKAATFIRKVRRESRKAVSPWTGTYQYTINQLIDEILDRVEELNLYLRLPFDESKNQFISMLSMVTLEYIHSGRNRMAR